VARARQFSSFILLVGRITGADTFEPKYATIIANKDDLRIPLLMETIPTPKEFRDAIESLSPEQQRFAKGFRAMQLESTLMGVAVIQIKPALEKLLNLPDDSLTKEIALTQDLLQLFMEYQIPSDQLSYGGDKNAAAGVKIATVQSQVNKMLDLTVRVKEAELKKAAEEAAMRILQAQQAARAAEVAAAAEASVRFSSREKEESTRHYSSSSSLRSSVATSSPAASASASAVRGLSRPMVGSAVSSSSSHSSATSSLPITGDVKSSSAPPKAPEPAKKPEPQKPADPQQKVEKDDKNDASALVATDYTAIPTALEEKYGELDVDGALRPTILNTGPTWTKSSKKSLLSPAVSSSLYNEEQRKERERAFDLLDALTKSGFLQLDDAALHVVIAATHCFDKSLVHTVIQDNINPIEKVERSSLIMASTIHGVAPAQLLQSPAQVERVALYSPMLITSTEVAASQRALPAPEAAAKAT
jgi:hypothetical protein